MALIHGYCDESYDGEHRVFTIAGFLGQDDEWARLSDLWQTRCLKDGISCYHSSDCAGQYGDFSNLPKDACIALDTDLFGYLADSKLAGFGVSVSYKDFELVSKQVYKSQAVLGSHPYFLAFQLLILRMCTEVTKDFPDYRMAFFFDQNERVSGQVKKMYDDLIKKNPDLSQHMGCIAYYNRRFSVPLQIADALAYETMKNAHSWLDGRADRQPIKRMKEAKVISRIDYLDRGGLEKIVAEQVVG
jgi:hypothetical protein